MLSRTLTPRKGEDIPFSTESITAPYKGTRYTISGRFIRKVVRDFALQANKPSFKMEDVYLSLKAGPNGPATMSILSTIKFLEPSTWTALFGLLSKEGLR